jgi:hypothetical protein
MKINGKSHSGNVSNDDGRVGWKYPYNSKEINESCQRFFEKRGMKQKIFNCKIKQK